MEIVGAESNAVIECTVPQTDPCCHGNQKLGILVPNLVQLGLYKRYSRESLLSAGPWATVLLAHALIRP